MYKNHIISRIFVTAVGIILPGLSLAGGSDDMDFPIKTVTIQCPSASALTKNAVSLTWSDKSGSFRSHDQSFADQIDRFAGAQWSGATLGYVICIYKPVGQSLFPIQLNYGIMAYQPSGSGWSAVNQGITNCIAKDPSKCPFRVRVEKKPGDVYQIADEISKGTDAGDTTPSF